MSKKKAPKHLKPAPVPQEAPKPVNYGIYFIIIAVILVVAAVLIAWDKLTVREIKIEGIENTNYLEVVHLSGIKFNSNIFTVDLDEVKDSIEQNPVLDVIEIKRKFPDEIIIKIAERTPIAAIETMGNYIVMDKDLVALSIQDTVMQPQNALITGTAVTEYQLGEEIKLDKDIYEKKLKELLDAMFETQTGSLIKSADISFTENIVMISKSGYEIRIGSCENVRNKFIWIKTMIPKLQEEGREGGILYITNVNSAHYMAPESTDSE